MDDRAEELRAQLCDMEIREELPVTRSLKFLLTDTVDRETVDNEHFLLRAVNVLLNGMMQLEGRLAEVENR